MTISATTQGLRMGVATSTSRPTVPFDGQVISETDTDSLQVYKGSAWAPVSGLTFITGGSFTASGTASLPTGSFSSTYKNYKVIYQLSAVSGANPLRIRFRTAGTDNSASSYEFAQFGYQYGAVATANNQSTGADNLYLGSSISYSALSMDVLTPQATAQTIMQANVNGNNGSVDAAFIYDARFVATTSFDSMTLYVSTGTITGTYRVYGYGDS
jgi:hypothetical protein